MTLRPSPVLTADRTGEQHDPVVALAYGDIDLCTADRWEAVFWDAAGRGPGDLVIDLSQVTFFGSAAVHLLVRLQASLGERERRLWVTRPSRITATVLTICGLEGLIR